MNWLQKYREDYSATIKIGVPIVGEVPRSNEIIHWEEQGKTVIEGDPASEISRCFFDLATLLWKEEENA